MTTVGCLSLIGMNSEGIALGTTNIRTTDARVGVGYLQIIHSALAQTTLADVERTIVEAPRAGAHYYYAAEQTAKRSPSNVPRPSRVFSPSTAGAFVHCNHILDAEQRSSKPRDSDELLLCRQSRMGELIGGRER